MAHSRTHLSHLVHTARPSLSPSLITHAKCQTNLASTYPTAVALFWHQTARTELNWTRCCKKSKHSRFSCLFTPATTNAAEQPRDAATFNNKEIKKGKPSSSSCVCALSIPGASDDRFVSTLKRYLRRNVVPAAMLMLMPAAAAGQVDVVVNDGSSGGSGSSSWLSVVMVTSGRVTSSSSSSSSFVTRRSGNGHSDEHDCLQYQE